MTSSSSASVAASWHEAITAASAMAEHTRHRAQSSGEDERDWAGATRLLALALWRIATDQQVTVDHAVLDRRVFGHLRLRLPLLDPPLPADADYPLPQGEFDPVLRLADDIMSANFGVYGTGEKLGLSDDGGPEPPCTVADRLDEITQEPAEPPLLAESDQVWSSLSALTTALTSRQWLPCGQDVRLAEAAHAALRLSPAQQADPLERAWLARLRHFAHAADTLRSTRPDHGDEVSPYLTALLTDVLALLDVVTVPLAELETAWTQRPGGQRLASWERRHMPLVLRAGITHTEHTLVMVASSLSACATGDIDP